MPQDSPFFDPFSVGIDLKTLATNSEALNRLTDELNVHVQQIETVVNALNLGLRAWVTVDSWSDEEFTMSHSVRLLYDKIAGNWGFVLDEYDEQAEDQDHWQNHQSWAFKDAPRKLRLQAVEKIPELIKALVKKSEEMTADTTISVDRAKKISSSVSNPVSIPTWGEPAPKPITPVRGGK